MDAIFFVLRTGREWMALTAAGVFEQLRRRGRWGYDELAGLDGS